MHLVLRDHLENGWLQMYTLDQVHDESWYDTRRHPGARAWRQLQYDEYVYREVVPLTYAPEPATTSSSPPARASARTTR